MKSNDEVMCRGDARLGTACGKCSRCEDARKELWNPHPAEANLASLLVVLGGAGVKVAGGTHGDPWTVSAPPTIVDLANADADGYRNGRASVVVELPTCEYANAVSEYSKGHRQGVRACRDAIIAAGGTVKE